MWSEAYWLMWSDAAIGYALGWILWGSQPNKCVIDSNTGYGTVHAPRPLNKIQDRVVGVWQLRLIYFSVRSSDIELQPLASAAVSFLGGGGLLWDFAVEFCFMSCLLWDVLSFFQDVVCDSEVTLRLTDEARRILRDRVRDDIERGDTGRTYRLTKEQGPRTGPRNCFQLYKNSSERFCITNNSGVEVFFGNE